MAKTLTQVELPSRAAWRAWLTEHHTQTESIWAVTFKKGHPSYMPYEAFVEELLCFGWIDGQAQKLDAERTMRLEAADSLVVPEDLQAALDARPGAEAVWAIYPPSLRRDVLAKLALAKRPETRAKRVEETARCAAEGKRPG